MRCEVGGIASFLPGEPVTNEALAEAHPDWSVERIASKTGILARHVAGREVCSSDLAVEAAERLFARGTVGREEIDYVLLCTQSPDYLLPTTACLLQERLGVRRAAGALDFNLGCSGYVYGLGLAQGLLATGQARCVLLLTAETYSKFLEPEDRSSVTIFGDAAAATVVRAVEGEAPRAVYVYGTDGRGGEHLMVRRGGLRGMAAGETGSLWMNGPEIFQFALRVVPGCVRETLERSGLRLEEVDLFVFHQANRYMLDALRTKLGIPEERFYVSMADCGNTVSSTLPIALERAEAEGRLRVGDRVMLVGFGVGLSWGATVLTWPALGVVAGR